MASLVPAAALAAAPAAHAAAHAAPLVNFAVDPVVSGLLLTIGLLGLLLEMQTLHGIAGAIAMAALAIFFGTHIAAGYSSGLVVVLALVGLLGIAYELHVVPGHGAPGVLGGIVLLAAVLLAFGTPFFFVALQTVASAIVLSIVIFYFATKALPENAFMKRITFAVEQGPEYVASSDYSALRGACGIAASFLRPSGVALIDGKRVDVLTEGEFISAGSRIVVKRVEGARIFVEKE